MREETFVARGTARWERLDVLLGRADRGGIRGLAPGDVAELGLLYRRLTSDLAYAQGRRFDPNLIGYINRLVVRGHAYVYGGALESGRARLFSFFTTVFPAEFRRSWIPIALCALLFTLTTVVSFAIVRHDPSTAYALVPGEIPKVEKSLHDSNFAVNRSDAPEMSALIITNNIRVSVMAFAGGMTLGALTVWAIYFNGLDFGSIGALFANAGFGYDFFATVAPHGVIELTAIQVAGGGGLLLAAGVLVPGRLRRSVALVRNARRAGVLMLGVCAMLVVAGTIEGFFSPLRLSAEIRLTFGALTGVALCAYFGLAGRARPKSLHAP